MKPKNATRCGKPTCWPNALKFSPVTCKMENSEFEHRRQAVAAELPAHKIEAMLIAFSPNLRYLSGFTGSNGALLVLPGRAILFTDPRYEIQASQESTCSIRITKGPLMDAVLAAV